MSGRNPPPVHSPTWDPGENMGSLKANPAPNHSVMGKSGNGRAGPRRSKTALLDRIAPVAGWRPSAIHSTAEYQAAAAEIRAGWGKRAFRPDSGDSACSRGRYVALVLSLWR